MIRNRFGLPIICSRFRCSSSTGRNSPRGGSRRASGLCNLAVCDMAICLSGLLDRSLFPKRELAGFPILLVLLPLLDDFFVGQCLGNNVAEELETVVTGYGVGYRWIRSLDVSFFLCGVFERGLHRSLYCNVFLLSCFAPVIPCVAKYLMNNSCPHKLALIHPSISMLSLPWLLRLQRQLRSNSF